MKLSPIAIIAIIIILIACLFTMPDVFAVSLNGIEIESTGLNTTIQINSEMNLTELTISSDSIYFYEVNHSNPSQASHQDTISYNITTKTNNTYTNLQLPYFSASSGKEKTIKSTIDGVISGSVGLYVSSCNLEFVLLDFVGTSYDVSINSSNYSCSDNFLELNYTGLGKGNNYITTIGDIIASNCTEGNITLSFSIYDEDNPSTPLISTAKVDMDYWYSDSPNYIKNLSLEYSGASTYGICLSDNATSIQSDIYIQYTTTNGFTHRYIISNSTLNVSDPMNISIYNFNTTTGISDLKITTRYNSNYNYYPDIISKLQRFYVDEGVWRTVQMDKSGDFGLHFFNIREQNTDYRLIFTDINNNILKTTEKLKFVCDSSICDLTVLLDPYSAVSGSEGLIITYSYSNETGIISLDWEDSLASTNTVVFEVTQDTVTGKSYICNTIQEGAAGSATCDVSGRSGIVQVKIEGNGAVIFNDFIDLVTGKIGLLIGDQEGAIWAAFIVITCLMFGIISPVTAIISMLIGLIAIYMLGIFTPLSVTFLIISSVVGIFIGFKVRN